MGKQTTLDIEYAALMSRNPEGTYLYSPPTFRKFHPGSVGFFDEYSGWNQITDLSKEGQPEADGFTPLKKLLNRDQQPKAAMWKTRSSESEAGQHIKLSAGLSAAAAAAVPVDVSADGKHKTSTSSKAALVTGSTAMREKVLAPFDKPVSTWASENAQALLDSDFAPDIAKNGIWIIQHAWVTDECAINMTNSSDKEIEVGLDIAATGIAKAGAGGGTFDKLKNEGWTTYKSEGDDGGLVVCFGGSHFKPRRFQRFRSVPIKQTQANSYLRTGPQEEMQLVNELDFESAKVGATESDAEEEAEAAAREEQEEQRQREELEKRAAEILKNTTTQTFVMQA
ncbi:uncharacterized protein N7473_008158 [Penicillium subrubescens]|uniref:Uncharacterized protein n=1 Tax=Penicillium subrubescens TaxID=1316194 RepID=A0A1Q5TF44_9EURO|nr:uncharacterized protein N7473_008158 [Penicillium subrubescens]KAJ5891930.1 hypothetical protein N7473_008158 [Penicillium subrubescens]OKO98848.1 hypothetical protein PENSUB_8765 [Penicillium subrubescens]